MMSRYLTEITNVLGLSRQRVDQIVRTDPTFPEPVAVITAGRILAGGYRTLGSERRAPLSVYRSTTRGWLPAFGLRQMLNGTPPVGGVHPPHHPALRTPAHA
jgi:hypothetical protein